MKIDHHLDAATIVAHAAGTLDEAFNVVAASHIAWCDVCREASRQAALIGGDILASLDGTDVSHTCRSETLSRLETATLHRFPTRPQRQGELPDVLDKMLYGRKISGLKWKTRAPGIAVHDIELSNHARGKLFLMRLAPGKAMPEHGHGGEEITLVLSGAYHDRFGSFSRGDVADLDEEIEHKPVVESETPCICLVATEAPTRFKSWPARLVQRFIGI